MVLNAGTWPMYHREVAKEVSALVVSPVRVYRVPKVVIRSQRPFPLMHCAIWPSLGISQGDCRNSSYHEKLTSLKNVSGVFVGICTKFKEGKNHFQARLEWFWGVFEPFWGLDSLQLGLWASLGTFQGDCQNSRFHEKSAHLKNVPGVFGSICMMVKEGKNHF